MHAIWQTWMVLRVQGEQQQSSSKKGALKAPSRGFADMQSGSTRPVSCTPATLLLITPHVPRYSEAMN